MSRFGPIRCYECGYPIDDIYEAFEFMRSVLNTKKESAHIDKFYINKDNSDSVEPIYRALKLRVNKICCLSHLLTVVLPKDIETD